MTPDSLFSLQGRVALVTVVQRVSEKWPVTALLLRVLVS